jgi:hypothetical protein
MTAFTFDYGSSPSLVWLRRGIIAIGVALILAFHHQMTDALVSCLRPFSPNPVVCAPPEATLPDNKDDPNSPDHRLIRPQVTVVTSASSVTPCSDPSSKRSSPRWGCTATPATAARRRTMRRSFPSKADDLAGSSELLGRK